MKNLLLLLSILFTAISCDPDNPDINKGKLDPNAMILLKPAESVQLRSNIEGLTALEIVEQAEGIKWQSHWMDTGDENRYRDEAYKWARGFAENQRDLSIPALKMWGTDIISQSGYMVNDFIYGYSVFITKLNGDTIAYVPDSVINNARPLIEAAYADSNYTEVYRIFNEAFVFLPID